MSSYVSLKSVLLGVGLVAALDVALVGFLAHVDFRMTAQMGSADEAFVAFRALEGLIVRLIEK